MTSGAIQDHCVTNDLNTLLTALYVKIDDELETGRRMGRPPQLTDSELVTLAVAQVCSASILRRAGCGTRTPSPTRSRAPGGC